MSQSIVAANLFSRPMRALATILAIALEVTLIIMVVGLTQGMIKETTSRMAGIGADIVFRPPNSSAVLASSSAILPIGKFADLLKEVEGVGEIAPVLVFWNTEKGSEFIFGINYESFDQVSHGFSFLAGGPFQGDHDVIIDDIKAESKKLKVGDELQFLNEHFHVVGIVAHGKGSRVFVPITTLQRLLGSPGKATLMLINSATSVPVAQTAANLQKRLPGYDVRSMGEFVSQMSEAYSSEAALKYFLGIVKFIAISVGVFAIFLAMYATITERTREIGILKSLGASKQYILWVFLQEALLLCLIGLVAGVGFSFLGVWLVKKWSKSLVILLTWQWMAKAGLIAAFSAMVGSIYPSMRAARRDPIDALGYE